MIIFRKFTDISAEFTACIGFFDGLHRGHQFLLQHLIHRAKANGTKSAVITFANHPRKVVQPDSELHLIDTLDERLAKIESAGIDVCFLLDFTEEIRQLTAEQFLKDFLSEKLHVRELLIGYDHRFGRNRAEGFDDYVRYGRECGMNIVQEPVFTSSDTDNSSTMGAACSAQSAVLNYSSSEVRRNLLSGNVALAAVLLGAPYALTGTVVDGHKLGRKLGFPTANIKPCNQDKIIPARGVYAVRAELSDGSLLPAMLNIGVRPTVDSTENLSLEVNIIDYSGNLYGQNIRIFFIDRIRDEIKMSSLDELTAQLAKDRQTALDLLN